MRIVLDALGGDYAPQSAVAGAVAAAREYSIEVILVGQVDKVRAELAKHDTAGLSLPLVDAPEVITMDEHPAMAVRRKKDSSIVVGMRLVRDGQADAFVSAGHTGACMTAALFILGRLPGVHRAPLATAFPNKKGGFFIFTDIGANTDCRPEYLLQFATMASIYAQRVYGLADPRVALLANGEEDNKGDKLVQDAHALLRTAAGLNFVGNVEPKEMLAGGADVVVADGFPGNLTMKTAEAIADMIMGMMRQELTRTFFTKMLAAMLRPAFRRLRARLDYSEYGGGLLLGLEGTVVIAHGRSNARAVQTAIRVARQAVAEGAVEAIAQALAVSGPPSAVGALPDTSAPSDG
jgi:glycerol-3-phosphate acyltransferase PlsX